METKTDFDYGTMDEIKLPERIKEQFRFCIAFAGSEDKKPYCVENGKLQLARTNAPKNFVDFNSAVFYLKTIPFPRGKQPMLGIWLGDAGGSRVLGIDIDSCMTQTAEGLRISKQAEEIIQLVDSYAELSPSGKGVHILLELPAGGEKLVAKKSVEFYCAPDGRFFRLTGAVLTLGNKRYDELRQVTYEEARELFFKIFPEARKDTAIPHTPADAPAPSRDLASLLNRVMPFVEKALTEDALFARVTREGDVSGFPSRSEADFFACCVLARCARDAGLLEREAYNFILHHIPQTGLYRAKWEERRGDRTYGERTAYTAVQKVYSEVLDEDKRRGLLTQLVADDILRSCRVRLIDHEIYAILDTESYQHLLKDCNHTDKKTYPGPYSKLKPIISKKIVERFRAIAGRDPTQQQLSLVHVLVAGSASMASFCHRMGRGDASRSVYLNLGGGTCCRIDTQQGTWEHRREPLPEDGLELVEFPTDQRLPHPLPPCSLSREEKRELIERLRVELLDNLEPEYRNQVLVCLFGLLYYDVPLPIVVITGPAGSGKSFLSERVLQRLVDPQGGLINYQKADVNDIVSVLKSGRVGVFDNLSRKIPDHLADLMCSITSLGRFQKRKLYTSESEVYQLRVLPILNGIDLVIHREDLFDRTMFIRFPRRRADFVPSVTERWLETDHPKLLSLLLDAAAFAYHNPITDEAIRRYARTRRYAGFLEFAAAGLSTVYTLDEVREIILSLHDIESEQVEENLPEDIVAEKLIELLNDSNRLLVGTPGEILNMLKPYLPANFSLTTRTLSKKLDRISSNPRYSCVKLTRERQKYTRWWRLELVENPEDSWRVDSTGGQYCHTTRDSQPAVFPASIPGGVNMPASVPGRGSWDFTASPGSVSPDTVSPGAVSPGTVSPDAPIDSLSVEEVLPPLPDVFNPFTAVTSTSGQAGGGGFVPSVGLSSDTTGISATSPGRGTSAAPEAVSRREEFKRYLSELERRGEVFDIHDADSFGVGREEVVRLLQERVWAQAGRIIHLYNPPPKASMENRASSAQRERPPTETPQSTAPPEQTAPERAAQEEGLEPKSREVLGYLRDRGPASGKTIAKDLGIHEDAVLFALNHVLQPRKLVERCRGPEGEFNFWEAL